MRRCGVVGVFAEVRTAESVSEGGGLGVIGEGKTVIGDVGRGSLIATLASTRVGSRNAKLFEERLERDLFTIGKLNVIVTRRRNSGHQTVVRVVLGRESKTASVTVSKDASGARSISALHASSRCISNGRGRRVSDQVAERVRDIGKAIAIICATALAAAHQTLGSGR